MVSLLSKLKYRFDLGSNAATVVSMALLVMSNKAEISAILGISPKLVLLLFVPLCLFLVFLFGQLLIWVKFPQKYNTEANLRNEQIEEILDILRRQKGIKPRRADVGLPRFGDKDYLFFKDTAECWNNLSQEYLDKSIRSNHQEFGLIHA